MRLRTNLFPMGEYFQSTKIVSNVLILFPIQFLCFQSKHFVSNLKRLFPMSFFCFQSKTIVSNLKKCFQSNLFPMYVSNLHITHIYISYLFQAFMNKKIMLVVLHKRSILKSLFLSPSRQPYGYLSNFQSTCLPVK